MRRHLATLAAAASCTASLAFFAYAANEHYNFVTNRDLHGPLTERKHFTVPSKDEQQRLNKMIEQSLRHPFLTKMPTLIREGYTKD